MENKFIKQLKKMKACNIALDWIREREIDTVEEFWKVSDRGDWILWLVENEYPGINMDIKILRELALEFAIMVLPYAIDKQLYIDYIYAIYQHLDGWIDFDELIKYRNDSANGSAAYYAIRHANYAANASTASYAISHAAYSADAAANAYTANAANIYAVNRQKVYKLQADLIRQYVPSLEIE